MKDRESMSRAELEYRYEKLRAKLKRRTELLSQAKRQNDLLYNEKARAEREAREAIEKRKAMGEVLIANGFRYMQGIGWTRDDT